MTKQNCVNMLNACTLGFPVGLLSGALEKVDLNWDNSRIM